VRRDNPGELISLSYLPAADDDDLMTCMTAPRYIPRLVGSYPPRLNTANRSICLNRSHDVYDDVTSTCFRCGIRPSSDHASSLDRLCFHLALIVYTAVNAAAAPKFHTRQRIGAIYRDVYAENKFSFARNRLYQFTGRQIVDEIT